MIPNLLAQAVILNRYVERIQSYEESDDQAGIVYIYSLIIRKVFLYNLPDEDEELAKFEDT